MSTKKIPLTVYENGQKKVIGEAVLDVEGPYVSIDAKVDPTYAHLIGSNVTGLSVGPYSIKNGGVDGDSS